MDSIPQPATADDLEEIKWLTAILTNPANDGPTRGGAARRLLGIGHPDAIAPLRAALISGDEGLILAVADALREAEEPPLELLEPLVEALAEAPEVVLDALSLVIARYGDEALAQVVGRARNTGLADAARLGAIHALGSFRNQAAAIELMALLDENAAEPILAATCEALRRGTGLPYGDEPAAWKRWWRDAVNQPPEQWLTNLVQRLAEQVAAEQQQTLQVREQVAGLERRLGETFRELFPLIREDEQMRRLRALMDDRLTSIRLFAVGRVERLLRDSIRVPDDVQAKLAVMLDDEDAEIRRRTARLIDQLGIESAGSRLAQRLGVETSPDVAAALMDLLIKRPTAAAIEPLRRWIGGEAVENNHALSDRAAAVVWELSNAIELDEAQRAALCESIRSADRWRGSAEHARLLGAVGNENDLHEIESLLDGSEPVMRRAVAEAFLRRSLQQPLLERSNDEVIYPFAVRALARGDVDMNAARQVLAMPPISEAARTAWNEALVTIAGRLPTSAILELDDLLAGQTSIVSLAQLRTDVLAKAREVMPESTLPELRVKVLTRLAQQLLLLDNAIAAHEVMESVNGLALDEESRKVRFEAAALSGNYDIAAQLEAEPAAWLHLLAALATGRRPAAINLRDEIDRRFGGRLDEALQADFEQLSELLRRERADANADSSA